MRAIESHGLERQPWRLRMPFRFLRGEATSPTTWPRTRPNAKASTGTTPGDGVPARVSAIACRQIVEGDGEAVVTLLARGFAARSRDYWVAAFDTLRERVVPEGCPRYGYCLTADGEIVGLILLIVSRLAHERDALRCNVSSWYVLPRFRVYASTLIKAALRDKRCTYINCSSVQSTRRTVLAQGFSCFAQGQYLAVAAAGPRVPGATVRPVAAREIGAPGAMAELLAAHAAYGCLSMICTMDGEDFPFIFRKRRVPHLGLPCAQLIYCRDMDSLVRLQGPVGRYLAAHGMPLVMLDANERIEGLIGMFFAGRGPKYYLGSAPPRLGDLTYSELVLFGP